MHSAAEHSEPVVIVGAGLSGLACAQFLHQAGIPALICEASDRVGGRVATDKVDGFQLDRGFQVFLTAYPEARRFLDQTALDLHAFYPGALVQVGRKRYCFADPWRRPFAGLQSLFAPVANLSDSFRIARLRGSVVADPQTAWPGTTQDYLTSCGLSQRVIDRFFRPFFGGVFLESELRTPAHFFRFIFAMFARGSAALPARGMHAIPQQMADSLPPGSIRLNTAATSVAPDHVQLASGETVLARAVVIATAADQLRKLQPSTEISEWNSTTTVYYDAPRSPLARPILLLNGDGEGIVNHVCVPSDVARGYAPPDRALVCISILGIPDENDSALDRRVRSELTTWFGSIVDAWRLLRVYRIPHALPRMKPMPTSPSLCRNGIFCCGDHLESPSSNGAMASGRHAAEAVLLTLGK